MYKCRLCGLEFSEIPRTWTRIAEFGRRGAWQVFRAADGTIHEIRKIRSSLSLHDQWHKTKLVEGCPHCFPPAIEPPPPAIEPKQEGFVLDGMDLIGRYTIEPPEAPQEIETPENETAMQKAWRERSNRC